MRLLKFNNENIPLVTRDREFRNLTSMLIPKDKFIDDNNGTLFIDLRYNIAKSLFEPTIQFNLNLENVDVNSNQMPTQSQ